MAVMLRAAALLTSLISLSNCAEVEHVDDSCKDPLSACAIQSASLLATGIKRASIQASNLAAEGNRAESTNWIADCPSSECAGFSWPVVHNHTMLISVDNDVALTTRDALLDGCGEICDTSARPGKLELLRKKVDCPALFANTQADAPSNVWPPPSEMPEAFKGDFLMGDDGSVEVLSHYFSQRTSGTEGAFGEASDVWSEFNINGMLKKAADGRPFTGYTDSEGLEIQNLVKKYKAGFEGKRLLVLGSLTPWLESILLDAGAAHVTTIEYGSLPKNPHPKISTMTPAEVAAAYAAGTLPKFEGGATYSRVEHSGLGRYGDTINPWGDLQAIAKLWCIMEPDSMFINGVPDGDDEVTWNAHRRYGERRWPHLMANWQHVDNTSQMGEFKQTAALYRKVAI